MFSMSFDVTRPSPSTEGMTSSFAPRARMSCSRSSLKQSAMTIRTAKPFARQTRASAGPVLPPVYSTMVVCGSSSASRSAPSTIESASRSFIEPVGFRYSSFTQSSAPFAGASAFRRTSGVFPIVERTVSAIVPILTTRFHRLFPDRDVFAAFARERFALPPAPAVAQPHPGKLRHEIQLRGPRVPEGNREPLDSPVDELEVMGREPLPRDVVFVDSPSRLAHVKGVEGLAGRKEPQSRYAYLNDEAAAGLQVRGDVAEARNLGRLGRQVRDRVEDQICDAECAFHGRRREVADRDADVFAAFLRSQLRDHRVRHVDPVHRHSPLRERNRDPARPDSELERASTRRELDEQVDDRLDDRRVEHLSGRLVVPRGDAFV